MLKWILIIILITIVAFLLMELANLIPEDSFRWIFCSDCNATLEVFSPLNYSGLKNMEISTTAKLLFDNIRWNHMPIKTFLDVASGSGINSFSISNVENARDAMMRWQERTNGTISFEEVSSPEEADLVIQWVRTFGVRQGTKILGEGGPTVRDTGLFNMTVRGEINIVAQRSTCLDFDTVLHELGHVIGFDHSTYLNDVMYPLASCTQDITDSEVSTISELYREEPKVELYFLNVSAAKYGRYFDLNFTVKNAGILNSTMTKVDVFAQNEYTREFDVPMLEPGESITERITNIAVPRETTSVQLIIDRFDSMSEYDKINNEITLSSSA